MIRPLRYPLAIALAPGQHAAATLAGPTVLVVEAGRGVVAAPTGLMAAATPGAEVAALVAGEAASHAVGKRLAVHNLAAAPLVVLLLTLTPAGMPDAAGA
jgi:hypothetical protein